MNANLWKLEIGATALDEGRTRFRVWAPKLEELSVRTFGAQGSLDTALEREEGGYFSAVVEGVRPGDRYFFLPQGESRPDPASRFQPEGVHGPSQVVDPGRFDWHDAAWKGVPLEEYVIYELHVGTFSREGTFDGVIPHLPYLKELGVTALELMPVAQFPGSRNWGYDGVFPFAPQESYGGPEGLRRLVDACHRAGLAVVLDVVYNHLGPEGNYLEEFGHYFTSTYQTPWGNALNYDGAHSDPVCAYFVSNALYWINEYHFDALRLDAVHGIFDFSAHHFLQQLAEAVAETSARGSRPAYLIAESALNDVRVISPGDQGGYGIDAQWNDDFHHALHSLLTGEVDGYYEDYGGFHLLAKAFREGYAYSGEYSSFRKRRHGNSSAHIPPARLVVFSQNHDQIGNRKNGDRLSTLVPVEKLVLVAAAELLSPYLPLIFMGEEYGETAPFLYFVSHGDPALVEAVRKGRSEEFACFGWEGEVPDPQAEESFLKCKLDLERPRQGTQLMLLDCYKKLLRVRREMCPAGSPRGAGSSQHAFTVTSFDAEQVLQLSRKSPRGEILCFFNFSERQQSPQVTPPEGVWEKVFDSGAAQWCGTGETAPSRVDASEGKRPITLLPWAVAVYQRRG